MSETAIENTKKFLIEARSRGVKIVYHLTQKICFIHNVDLWCKWFEKIGVGTTILTDQRSIKPDDLCVLVGAIFAKCLSKSYIYIQAENKRK